MTVGKELLIGRTLNTNAHWVGGRLARMGTQIHEITTVDDILEEISSGVHGCLGRNPDFLVVVGGLGPTPDDMTLTGVAQGLRREMKLSRPALLMLKKHYARRGMSGIEMTAARRKMAVLPADARPVDNRAGTAPGARIEERSTVIYCLPGVPSEMRTIFRDSVEPEVRKAVGSLARSSAIVHLGGIFESSLAPILTKVGARHPGAYIKSHPGGIREGVSRIELDIVAVGKNRLKTKTEVSEIESEIAHAVRSAGATFGKAGQRDSRSVL